MSMGAYAQTYYWSVISSWPYNPGAYPSADALCRAIHQEYDTRIVQTEFPGAFIYPYQSPYPSPGGDTTSMNCPVAYGNDSSLWGASVVGIGLEGNTCPAGTTFNALAGACEDPSQPIPRKEIGCGCDKLDGPTPSKGDPINSATGNVFESETDYSGEGNFPLRFIRYYNSADGVWRENYSTHLVISTDSIELVRETGEASLFTLTNGVATAESTELGQLSQVNGSWVYVGVNGDSMTFDSQGRLAVWRQRDGLTQTLSYSADSQTGGSLVTVVDAFGRSLSFAVDGSNRPVSLSVGSLNVAYVYNGPGELTTVTYAWPGGSSTKRYVYEDTSNVALLTGLIDESGVRYSTWGYDNQSRGISSTHADGVDQTTFLYNDDRSTTVTDALGHATNYQYQVVQGVRHISAASSPATTNSPVINLAYSYNTIGQPYTEKDGNGITTQFNFNPAGLLAQRVDAQNTSSQRIINSTWDTTLRVPLTRTVQDSSNNFVGSTQWVYNATGQILARCDIDPTNTAASSYTCHNNGTVPAGARRWTYTYCTAVDTTQCPIEGLLLMATGPRTDTPQITSYSYYMASSATNCGTPGAACYQAGDLHTVVDTQGHVTTVASYDADGRITRITDANGINTDMTYTPRGWLASRSVGDATTSFTYTPYGAVQTVTDADGVTTTYGYDAAHRLVKITDALGNYIQYTLDAAGNKTSEQVYDASGTLHKSLTRSFNNLGQLAKAMDGLNHTIFDASASNSYDANGNLVQSVDGLGIQRQQGYDPLNRLVQTIDNYNGTN
jgi:YD repeat-containing protein